VGVIGYFIEGSLFSIIFLTYLFSPKGFLVDIHHLLITRLAGGISISYSSMYDIKVVENVQLFREIGVGGFFSCTVHSAPGTAIRQKFTLPILSNWYAFKPPMEKHTTFPPPGGRNLSKRWNGI